MARGSNTAYDFDLFQTQPQPKKKKQSQKPQLHVVEQRESIRSRNFTLRVVGCVVAFFIGVVGILMSQISLTEITKELSDETAKLNRLQADYRTLETELESSVALSNIEGTVTRDLGMTKLRDDQVTYIGLTEPTVEEILITDDSILGRIKDGINSLLAFWKQEDAAYPTKKEQSNLSKQENMEEEPQETPDQKHTEEEQEVSLQETEDMQGTGDMIGDTINE